MDKSEMERKMRGAEFVDNNGHVMAAINLLHEKYVRLSSVCAALESRISKSDICKSVNFLEEEGYIKIRTVADKQPASISDCDIDVLEAKLSGKGIRLMRGSIRDPDVTV